jgi:4-carboxymuconolactone decarboxylase
MGVSKHVGVILLLAAAGALSWGTIQARNWPQNPAQNPPRSAGSAAAPLPKDIYPDSRTRLPLATVDADGNPIVMRKSELPVGIEQPGISAWSPQYAKLMGPYVHYIKYEIGLSNGELEIAILVVSREMDSQYLWTQYEEHGRNPSDPRHIEQSTIDIIKYEKPATGLSEKETAIIEFGRETFGQRLLSPNTFADLLRLFGRKGGIDLIDMMSGYSGATAELVAFDNQLRADQKPLLPPIAHPRNPARFAAAAANPLPADVYAESRNRFALPRRDDMDDYGKKVFDETNRGKPLPNGAVPAGFLPTGTPQPGVLLWDPKLAELRSPISHYLKYQTGLPPRLEEIAVLVTAYEMDCQYEWTQWEMFGRNAADPRHIEQSTIDIIKYDRPVAGLGEKEAAIIEFGRETFGRRKVSSETFAKVLGLFGRKGTVDLLELMASYAGTAGQLTAIDEQLQPGQKPLLPPHEVSVGAHRIPGL